MLVPVGSPDGASRWSPNAQPRSRGMQAVRVHLSRRSNAQRHSSLARASQSRTQCCRVTRYCCRQPLAVGSLSNTLNITCEAKSNIAREATVRHAPAWRRNVLAVFGCGRPVATRPTARSRRRRSQLRSSQWTRDDSICPERRTIRPPCAFFNLAMLSESSYSFSLRRLFSIRRASNFFKCSAAAMSVIPRYSTPPTGSGNRCRDRRLPERSNLSSHPKHNMCDANFRHRSTPKPWRASAMMLALHANVGRTRDSGCAIVARVVQGNLFAFAADR
jgi:hypothetical protein